MSNPKTEQDRAIAESMAQVVESYKGRKVTRGELAALFSLVEDKVSWKNPIDATVRESDLERLGGNLELLEIAVIFFTGSMLFRSVKDEPGVWRVQAIGYYESIGA